MSRKLTLLFILFASFVMAQNIEECYSKTYFEKLKVESIDPLKTVLKYLDKPYDFKLIYSKLSNSGSHYSYRQIIDGKEVFASCLKINTDLEGNIISIFDLSFDPDLVLDSVESFDVYFYNEGVLYPAKYSKVLKEDYHQEVIEYDNQVFIHPLIAHFEDTTINVTVFDPDPLTTSANDYGGSYVDNNDADTPFLNNERVIREIPATYDSGTFYLENDYVKMMDLSNPIQTVVTSTTPDFSYTRNQDGFEEVNTFYHISNQKQYFESIGLDTLMNYQIQVDAHALNGSDNSMFVSSFDPPRLLFGDGGVDDAEDADVILHEYGHAIQYFCAPNSNFGLERTTLDEANGDYFAASYSKSISDYNWGDVYSWDGHNEYWDGRNVITTDHYPQDLEGNRYRDADIWAATIMEIHDVIGREETDKILIESMYSYSSNISLSDAARLFVQADSLLNGGENYQTILHYMAHRGLLPWDTINGIQKDLIEWKVFQLGNDLIIEGKHEKLRIEYFDLNGRLIYRREILPNNNKQSVSGMKNGIYLVRISENNGFSRTLKMTLNQ